MLEGPVVSSMLIYVIPIVLSGILQSLFSAADIAVVGNFGGQSSVAAIGASSAIISFLVNVTIALSAGVNMVLARAIGSGDEARIRRTVGTSFVLSVTLGVIIAAAGILLAKPLLCATGCPEGIISDAVLYMRLYFAGVPATMLYNFMSPLLTLGGDSLRPFIYLSVSGAVNVALNLLFVIGFNMEVAGVAISTAISLYLSAALLMVRVSRLDGALRFSLRTVTFSGAVLEKMLHYGVPSSVSTAASAFSSIYIQTIVNSYGEAGISGNTAAANIETFMFAAFGAFYSAIPAFMGQNIGAGKRERALKIARVGTVSLVILGALFSTLGFLFGEGLLSLYVPSSPEAVAFGMVRMRRIMSLGIICSLTYAIGPINQSFGHSVFTGALDLLTGCVFRVFWLAVVYTAAPSPSLLYLAFPLAWLIVIPVGGTRALVSCHRYKRGKSYEL